MVKVERVFADPEVFRIHVPLPRNALDEMNSYLVRDGDDAVLIDTGFDSVIGLETINVALSELGLEPTQIDLFITHSHSDHYSLAGKLPCKRVIMSEGAYNMAHYVCTREWDVLQHESSLAMGFTPEQADLIDRTSPSTAQTGRTFFQADLVTEDDVLQVGRYAFRFIMTSGHSPEHLSLYLPEKELLFTGDHILFGISPNVAFWNFSPDTLQQYLDGLRKLRDVPVSLALPGHRDPRNAIAGRVDELIAHHERRLDECFRAIREKEGQSIVELARSVSWSGGRQFDKLNPTQQLFAAVETRAHVEHLFALGEVTRDDTMHYYVVS